MGESTIVSAVVWYSGALISALSAWYAIPWISRIRFETRMTDLRNRCQEAMIRGELPDNEVTQDFLWRQAFLTERSRQIKLLIFDVIGTVRRRHGIEEPLTAEWSYEDFTEGQRDEMKVIRREAVDALASYMAWGSQYGWARYVRFRTLRFLKSQLQEETVKRLRTLKASETSAPIYTEPIMDVAKQTQNPDGLDSNHLVHASIGRC